MKRIDNLVIKFVRNFQCRELYPLLLQAELELMQYGAEPEGTVSEYNDAFYAEIDGKAVAVLCWSNSSGSRECWISLGYVMPEHRGKGIYGRLFDTLEKHALKKGLRSIAGSTHAQNAHMLEIAKHCGQNIESITYRKVLPFKVKTVSEANEKKG